MAWDDADPLEDTVNVLVAAGRFAYGTDDKLTSTAEEWLNAGFGPQDTHDWLQARCFEPSAAAGLKAAGFDPDTASRKPPGKAETYGYLVSNGEMKAAEAGKQAGVSPEDW